MNDPLPWSDVFLVGNPILDAEHRLLVGLINRVCRAWSGENGAAPSEAMAELEAVTESHFQHEQNLLEELFANLQPSRRMMRETIAAARKEHGAAHLTSLEDLRLILRRAAPKPAPNTGASLSDALISWFVDHGISQDAQLKTIIQSV